jgi:hypothetical protein
MAAASHQRDDTETAGAITRPLFLYFACLILGFVLDRVPPLSLIVTQRAFVY